MHLFSPNLYECASWYCENDTPKMGKSVCASRDLFQGRLDNFYSEASQQKTSLDQLSLLVAVLGEIGNNSFDHNLGQFRDIPGCWFGFDITSAMLKMWIADRGNGILNSLKNVLPTLEDESQALEIAFTKRISGRAPEKRGNGLKFVRSAINGNRKRGLLCFSGTGKIQLGDFAKEFGEIEDELFPKHSSKAKGVLTLIVWDGNS